MIEVNEKVIIPWKPRAPAPHSLVLPAEGASWKAYIPMVAVHRARRPNCVTVITFCPDILDKRAADTQHKYALLS